MKLPVLILLKLTIAISVFSQPTLQWSYSHSHFQMQWSNAVKVVVEKTNTPLVLDMVWGWEVTPLMNLYKLNQQNGNFIWQRGGVGSSEGRKLFVDSLNNIFVGGSTKLGFAGTIPFIMKCSASGGLIFYKSDSTQPFPNFASVCIDSSGNSYLLSSYQGRFKIIKYDPVGNLAWNALYSVHDSINQPGEIALDRNNNIWIVGSSFRSNNWYLTILKQSVINGLFLDTTEIAMPSNFVSYELSVYGPKFDLSSNSYISFKYQHGSSWKRMLLKLSSDLNTQWMKIDSGLYYDPFPNFIVLSNGSIIKNRNIGVEKVDPNGTAIWSYNFGYINDISTDGFGNIYLTGSTNYTYPSEYYTCKLNGGGSFVWSVNYNYPNMGTNTALSIALDTGNNVFVHGESAQYPSDAVSTVKYSQTTGIQSLSSQIPNEMKLHQNFPNPFNPETRIRFDVTSKQKIIFIICDIVGQEILRFEHANLPAGSYEYVWNAEKFSSGVYFAKIFGSDFTETKRMVLIK